MNKKILVAAVSFAALLAAGAAVAQTDDSFVAASTNVPGAAYPRINSSSSDGQTP
jgi:hypothetical protein